ncbi:MAG: pyruvate kinase [Acidobacteriota bacterium]|nr:pyruvate kinase [Acidobacteriota bacterium]MDE3140084.1 pyruvate kinase [Acidobacteriota bacterium]
MRRTRIVATIGPASESDEVLKNLVKAGVDVFRVSMAHGDIPSNLERLRRVRAVAPDIAIMVDIPGPKIRAGSFGTMPVHLDIGQAIELVEAFGETSTAERIAVEREGVLAQLKPGDRIHIGDGGISLVITTVGAHTMAEVTSGGAVVGKPGMGLPSSILNDRLPTDDDRARLEALKDEDIDMLAVSFVRSAFDMVSVRSVLSRDDVMLMSKIETGEGVENLDEIVAVSDAIMVARGDLGVRMPIEEVPHLQKLIVRHGIRYARPVVVATQMLESMTHAQVPTRAEVTDVANAVLDGASAVMLSGETAIGDDPVGTVITMDRIVRRAEASFDYAKWGASLELQSSVGHANQSTRVTAAITGAAWRAAMEENAVAIVACTRSGMTARAISRFRPPMPIVAITPSTATARQLRGSWGVDEVVLSPSHDIDELCDVAVNAVKKAGIAQPGDPIVIMAGSTSGGAQVTDTVRMLIVP